MVESSLYPAEYGLHNYIRAIFLFGTPHQGLRTTELWEMVDEDSDYSAKVKDLLAQLREGSEFLENQKQALGRVLGDFRGRVCTFYETELSKSVKKVSVLNISPLLVVGAAYIYSTLKCSNKRNH